MLMTGKEYLGSIRDGRRVYIGGELVEDVTTHPAFRNAAQSFAMIHDRKRDPENRRPDDVRGGWRNLLDLFLAAADA
jgi:aromatic ring hydroxylase